MWKQLESTRSVFKKCPYIYSVKTIFEISKKLFFKTFFIERKKFQLVNAQAPVAHKSADEVVFRGFEGEGVDFFKIGPH